MGSMTRRHRTEVLLVAAIVIMFAFYVRWEYRPFEFERHVNVFEDTYGVDVGEPGRWFSAWALGDGQAYALIATDPGGEPSRKESTRQATDSPGPGTAGRLGPSRWASLVSFPTRWRLSVP